MPAPGTKAGAGPAGKKPAAKTADSGLTPGDRELLQDVKAKLAELETQLLWVAPRVRTFPVVHPDPTRNMLFLELEHVCYATTQSEDDRYNVMFVTEDGGRFYSAKALTQIAEEVAAGNSRFMQSGRAYMINLEKVTAFRVSEARDLWFKGSDEPVVNAVTGHWLREFERRLPH